MPGTDSWNLAPAVRWGGWGSNPRPWNYEFRALTTELPPRRVTLVAAGGRPTDRLGPRHYPCRVRWLVWLCRVLLAGVFLVSSGAKLTDRSGTRQSLSTFRVPAPLIRWWFGLPVAEAVVAALILVDRTRIAGAGAAIVLLALFTAVLWREIRAGNTAPCRCFGSLSRAPLSPGLLVRNGLFLALAVVATASPSAPIIGW